MYDLRTHNAQTAEKIHDILGLLNKLHNHAQETQLRAAQGKRVHRERKALRGMIQNLCDEVAHIAPVATQLQYSGGF